MTSIDLSTLEAASSITQDDRGEPVIQIPLPLWQAYKSDQTPGQATSQGASLLELLDAWANQPEDNSPEWWDEFDVLLTDYRLTLRYS